MRARIAAAGEAGNYNSTQPVSCVQVKIHGAAEAAGPAAKGGSGQASEGDPSTEDASTGTQPLQ